MFNIDKSCIQEIIHNRSYKDENYSITTEQIETISKAVLYKRRKRTPIQDELGNLFASIKEAALHYKVSDDTIRYRLKNGDAVKSKYNLPLFSYK